MIRKLYGILENPFLYRLSQAILVPGATRLMGPIFRKMFTVSAGKVLDVGCGPKIQTPPPQGLLVGVDINESYIRRYTGGSLDRDPRLVLRPPPGRDRMGFLASAEELPFKTGSFDEVRSSAFFHHVDRSQAVRTLRQMRRCVKKGGRIVVWDAVWPKRPWARPLAWLTLSLDRGRHMRTEEELVGLFQEAWPGRLEWGRHTYSYTGLELLYFIHIKP